MWRPCLIGAYAASGCGSYSSSSVTNPGIPAKATAVASMREYNRKVEWKYLRKFPASAADVPAGKVVVHNQVIPGTGGFRAWTQIPDDTLKACPCGWPPQLGKHYRKRPAG